jgi:hypothetical protein
MRRSKGGVDLHSIHRAQELSPAATKIAMASAQVTGYARNGGHPCYSQNLIYIHMYIYYGISNIYIINIIYYYYIYIMLFIQEHM